MILIITTSRSINEAMQPLPSSYICSNPFQCFRLKLIKKGQWMQFETFLVHLHFSAEELLLYPRCQRRRQCRRWRPHAKC